MALTKLSFNVQSLKNDHNPSSIGLMSDKKVLLLREEALCNLEVNTPHNLHITPNGSRPTPATMWFRSERG
jgi:hypothetical protein